MKASKFLGSDFPLASSLRILSSLIQAGFFIGMAGSTGLASDGLNRIIVARDCDIAHEQLAN